MPLRDICTLESEGFASAVRECPQEMPLGRKSPFPIKLLNLNGIVSIAYY